MVNDRIVPRIELVDAVTHAAMRFAKEVTLSSLATHLVAFHNVVITQEELTAVCRRLDYFVTTVMKYGKPTLVARVTKGHRFRKKRAMYVGLDLSVTIQNKLDELLTVGDLRFTSEVYPQLRETIKDGESLSTSKITRSLEPQRYRVGVRSVDGVPGRAVERLS